MNFAATGIVLTLALFLIAYLSVSLVVFACWRGVLKLLHHASSHARANALFYLRVLPFISASVFTFCFTIPSFFLTQPNQKNGSRDLAATMLGACGVAILGYGAVRAVLVYKRATQTLAVWMDLSSRMPLEFDSLRRDVGLLLTIGMFPLALAFLFTAGFTFPSFWLLNLGTSSETICLAPFFLAISCLLIFSIGLARVLTDGGASCSIGPRFIRSGHGTAGALVEVFRTHAQAPSVAVAGINSPKVLISESAIAALGPDELRAALKHEVAHVQAGDNLKKLVFRFLEFPGMHKLEQAWAEAAEFAADDRAVSSSAEALDLAAALIKISRIHRAELPALAAALVPNSALLAGRVERLFAWDRRSDSKSVAYFGFPLLAVAVALAITFYTPIILDIHRLAALLAP